MGTTGRRCNFYCHIFSCFKFCIFELLCFDLCGGVGGHNVQFVLSAFLHFCIFSIFSWKVLICVVVLVGTMGRRCREMALR